jgi:MFS family permease
MDTVEQSNLSWFNRNVVGMGLTSLFSDTSHEMATAILPFFILFDLSGTAAVVGLVEGMSDGISSTVKSYSGYLSDRIGRRTPLMYLGYALTGVLIPAIGFSTSWLQVLVLRVGAWMGRGARGPPRDALLAESAPANSVGRAFGFHRGMDTAGAVIGPAIALVLLPYFSYSSIFLISAIPGVVSIVVLVTTVRDARTRKKPILNGFRESIGRLPREFKMFLIAVGLFGIANFSNVIFVLRAEEVLQPSLGQSGGSTLAITLYVLLNLVYALASFPVGHLADRVSKRGLLAAGYLTFALASVASILETPSLLILAVIFILAGLHVAIVDTVEGAYAADLLGESLRGSGFGVLQTINGVGDFISSTLIGVMLTLFDPLVGFTFVASTSIVASLLLVVLT